MNGKGDKQRPEQVPGAYARGWERIFGTSPEVLPPVPRLGESMAKFEQLVGDKRAKEGDWIIKGEFYPCKPDVFQATYEPVGDGQVTKPWKQYNKCSDMFSVGEPAKLAWLQPAGGSSLTALDCEKLVPLIVDCVNRYLDDPRIVDDPEEGET